MSRRSSGAGRRRNRPWEGGEGGEGFPGGGMPGAVPGAAPGGMGMGGPGGGFTMFDPATLAARRQMAARTREAEHRVTELAKELVPEALRPDCQVVVFDACGCSDLDCEPSGTVIQYLFRSGQNGVTVTPKPIFNVTAEDVSAVAPPPEIMEQWAAGVAVEWPPRPVVAPPPMPDMEVVRFPIGTRVRCRVGPDPVEGWRGGVIVKHYYREPRWPPGKWVPYQVELDGGTLIYAPQDIDRLIKRDPDAADNAEDAATT